MNYGYVSFLSTDSYLPGALVLHHSLARTGARHPFVLLVAPNVSASARAVLTRHAIPYRTFEPAIAPPRPEREHCRWDHTYAKLHIFDLVEFDRIVYLDADMLVNGNLDDLFDRPHMSAVNSGGLLPEYASWTQLNSGLMVVEPAADLFAELVDRVRSLGDHDVLGDQKIIQEHFSDWPDREELHLDHRYNVFHTHVDRYHELFGYTLDEIKVLHFIGETKPWSGGPGGPGGHRALGWRGRAVGLVRTLTGRSNSRASGRLREAAVRMWHQCYAELSPPDRSVRAAAARAPGVGPGGGAGA